MAKKYGDVVSLVRNSVPLNAIVVQSNVQPDGEHLTVVYLDPTFDSPIIGGSALQRAVSTAFAVPFKDGQVNGWKPVEVLTEEQILQMQMNFGDTQQKNDERWEKQLEAALNDAVKLRGDVATLNEQKADLLKQIAALKTPAEAPKPQAAPQTPPVPPAKEEPKK